VIIYIHPIHLPIRNLINLLSVTASLGKLGPSSSWLTKHNITRSTEDYSLCMTEDSGNLKASRTLDIHEETIGALHKTLELVCAGFLLGGGIQEIDRHVLKFAFMIICEGAK